MFTNSQWAKAVEEHDRQDKDKDKSWTVMDQIHFWQVYAETLALCEYKNFEFFHFSVFFLPMSENALFYF